MSKEIYISSTPHETRLAIVENDALAEIYYERENEYTLAGSIYNGKVTRVLPGMQSSFVDIGLERDAFLYITDFMEEAGDSADFEANANAGDHQRAPRRDGQRDGQRDLQRGRSGERDSRGRGDREPQNRDEQSPTPEPSDTDLFNHAMAQLEPGRAPGEGQHGDAERTIGRRRRGRGGRGEGRSSNLGDNGERGVLPRPETTRLDDSAPIEGDPNDLSVTAVPLEDLGEGAPGADGSRRWRGRRGRRGSQSSEGRPATSTSASSTPATSTPAASTDLDSRSHGQERPATGPVANAYDQASDEPDSWDEPDAQQESLTTDAGGRRVDLNASTVDVRNDRGTMPQGRAERNRSGIRQGSGDRGRTDRDRNDRDRRPGERGEAPRYGEPEYAATPAEPIILPGESLSKYGTGGSETPAAEASEAAPTASDFTLRGSWDGGLVLPGETLRPRTSAAPQGNDARASRRPEEANRSDRNRGDRSSRGRDERGGRDRSGPRRDNNQPRENPGAGIEGRSEATDRLPSTENFSALGASAESLQHQSGHQEARHESERPSSSDLSASAPVFWPTPEPTAASGGDSTFVAPPPLAAPPASFPERATDAHSPTGTVTGDQDRLAAFGPNRDAAGRDDAAKDNTVNNVVKDSAHDQNYDQDEEQAASHPGIAQEYEPTQASASYRVDPAAPSEFRQAAPVLEPESVSNSLPEISVDQSSQSIAEPVGAGEQGFSDEAHASLSAPDAAHDHDSDSAFPERQLTSISAAGEMHSDDSTPVAAENHELPPQQQAQPADPITHEHAVVEPFPATEPLPHFEPGSGLLEEEMMEEDEEGETLPILTAGRQISSREASDGEATETLEGAADLATMLRELSIDQITRSSTGEDDAELDDDFDDEDFEEERQADDGSNAHDGADSEDDDDESENGLDESLSEDSEVAEDSRFAPEDRVATDSSDTSGQSGQLQQPRRSDRRDGRRDGRGGDRGRRSTAGGERSPDRAGERSGSDRGADRNSASDRGPDRNGSGDRNRQHGRGRQSMQSTNLPAISELLKPGQEILCQIAKEPIAKKGARITSHIALPGRFLVFMPTVSHTGVSRKIESDGERRRLKEILLSEKGEAAGGFIVRTAAAGASEEELRSDLRFLLNLWTDIKARSESSKSPALIYHDLNLVERVLRDQVTDTFSAIWVDTETEYERVLRFLQRFQPSLIRRVKLYTKETPLFEQFGITDEINKALRSKVWLKSGGSIVINQTEALVAIDINTGKFVGKTARLEDTIVKTNLDAIPEIVRQIRLRDLGGIIIIDFIDMDERKNRNRVMAALEDELKFDRAPSKVLQFNDFGLVAITRKRVKQSLERTLSTTCGICAGTGMVKSPVTVCNDIYVEMRKMHKHLDRGDVMLRVNPEVVKQLKSGSGRWLQEMEEMVGKTILVKSDPALHPEQFDIH